MGRTSVLVIGLEPSLIDFSEEGYRAHPGLNAEVARAGLEQARFDCVVIGAGLWLNAGNTMLFETVVNIVHEHAPRVRLCFNTRATDMAEAVQRWFGAE